MIRELLISRKTLICIVISTIKAAFGYLFFYTSVVFNRVFLSPKLIQRFLAKMIYGKLCLIIGLFICMTKAEENLTVEDEEDPTTNASMFGYSTITSEYTSFAPTEEHNFTTTTTTTAAPPHPVHPARERETSSICSVVHRTPAEVHVGNAFFVFKKENGTYALLTTASSVIGRKDIYLSCFTSVLNDEGHHFNISKKLIHPDFSPAFLLNDVALLFTNEITSEFEGKVVIFHLPKPFDYRVGSHGIYYRWIFNASDTRLHQAKGNSTIISNAKATLLYHRYIGSHKICVETIRPTIGPFDDGAPLAIRNGSGKLVVEGLYNDQFYKPISATCYDLVAQYTTWFHRVLGICI